eukprot:3705697-Rhodomonas_salina.4
MVPTYARLRVASYCDWHSYAERGSDIAGPAAFETVLDTEALDRVRFEIGLGTVNASPHDIAGAILVPP